MNAGTIAGGNIYFSQFSGGGGSGGVGVKFGAGGVLINHGTVIGGDGVDGGYRGGPGTAGGDGFDMLSGGFLKNTGSISGGAGGGAEGVLAANGGIAVYLNQGIGTNSGTFTGGSGGIDAYFRGVAENAGVGGAGLKATESTFDNHGLIAGGVGGTGGAGRFNVYSSEGDGGVGVDLQANSTITNFGTVAGGEGGFARYSKDEIGVVPGVGGAGGAGLLLSSASSANNHGTIVGGAGGYVQDSVSSAGVGGAGVILSSDAATLTNAGYIVGGVGGAAYDVLTHNMGVAANGGNGVDLFGGVMKNTGTITGGAGGYGVYQGGAGGVGVYINGGTMVSSGTISGGAGGHGGTINGAAGVAVQFGAAASTLIIDPGAKFEGAIVANSAARDTLVLGGTANGQLSGFGTSITGFSTIDEAAHAHWILTGNMTGVTALAIGTGASLQLNGGVNAGDIIFSRGGHETLKLDAPGKVNTVIAGFAAGDVLDLANVHVSAMSFLHGTLTLMDGASTADTLRFSGAFTAADFVMHADGAGGTDITLAQAAEPAWHGGWTPQELRWDIFSWQHH